MAHEIPRMPQESPLSSLLLDSTLWELLISTVSIFNLSSIIWRLKDVISGHTLNEFVRRAALPYLESDNPAVRQGAALTCCRLFISDPICHHASNHSIEIISDVLDKLLTVGIADPGMFYRALGFYKFTDSLFTLTDAHIRGIVLSNLDERFDRHLSQTENVRSLFIALNDEVYENRRKAIDLIGRMAMHNPAYVMPSLRKALIQLLTELQYTTNVYDKIIFSLRMKLLISSL